MFCPWHIEYNYIRLMNVNNTSECDLKVVSFKSPELICAAKPSNSRSWFLNLLTHTRIEDYLIKPALELALRQKAPVSDEWRGCLSEVDTELFEIQIGAKNAPRRFTSSGSLVGRTGAIVWNQSQGISHPGIIFTPINSQPQWELPISVSLCMGPGARQWCQIRRWRPIFDRHKTFFALTL